MKIKADNWGSTFNYLSVKGSAITYDTNVVGPGNPITGPITASTFTDRAASRDAKELALNFTVAAVAGLLPTLDISFLVLDPMEPSNGTTGIPPSPVPPAVIVLPLNSGRINKPTTIRLVIADGQAVVWNSGTGGPGGDQANAGGQGNGGNPTVLGAMNVPMLWQVQINVGGRNPSLSLIASYEQRA